MTKDIISIFEKYDTDKREHGYPKYYQKHLPDTAKKILEVGVFKGESIKMWHELYPEAKIYGLDLFKENPIPFEADWVTWFQGSQRDGDLLGHIRAHGPFDVIIEDGSHNSRDQLINFYGLVDCCTLYICEDLHCAKEEFYRQGMLYRNTMLCMMKNASDPTLSNHQSIYFNFPFHLYDDKIAFIYQADEDYRYKK